VNKHPWQLEARNGLAHRLGCLMVAMVGNLIHNTSDTTMVYPRKFAVLASTPEDQQSCLREQGAARSFQGCRGTPLRLLEEGVEPPWAHHDEGRHGQAG
jgi:hypothetical protein